MTRLDERSPGRGSPTHLANLTDLQMLSRALLQELARHGQETHEPMSRRGFFRSTAQVFEDLIYKLYQSMACIAFRNAYEELIQSRVSSVGEVGESVEFLLRVLSNRKAWHPSEVFFHLRRLNQYRNQL